MDNEPPPITLGIPLQFQPSDFLQVFKVVSDDWWIGRLVGGGSAIGLIPSPAHFERRIASVAAHHKIQVQTKGVMRRMSSLLSMFKPAASEGEVDVEAGPPVPDLPWKEKVSHYEQSLGKIVLNSRQDHLRGHDKARHAFARPNPDVAVYDNAPRTRPIVFVGPSKIGSPVTDQMQRALMNYLDLVFPNVILEAPTHSWKDKGQLYRGGFRPLPDKTDGKRKSKAHSKRASELQHEMNTTTDASEVIHPDDLKFAKKHFYDDQLTLFLTDPEDLMRVKHSSLMPVVVMIQVRDDDILSKLIKECGEGKIKKAEQLKSAAFLHDMNEQDYDLVLTDANLSECCHKLQAFMDMMLGEAVFSIEEDTDYPDAMAAAAAEAASARHKHRRKSVGGWRKVKGGVFSSPIKD